MAESAGDLAVGSAWTDEELEELQQMLLERFLGELDSGPPIMDWSTGEFTQDMHGKLVRWIAGPQKLP